MWFPAVFYAIVCCKGHGTERRDILNTKLTMPDWKHHSLRKATAAIDILLHGLPLTIRSNADLILAEEREFELTNKCVGTRLAVPPREGNEPPGFRDGIIDTKTVTGDSGIADGVVGKV